MSIARGRGKSWGVRQWELETINAIGWTEAAWGRLSLAERARKVCAHKLRDWMGALESELEIRRMKARHGA